MSYKVVATSDFAKEARRIAKKHPGIKTAIADLIKELSDNPESGVSLGHQFYKIRLAIAGKGKLGGARAITYVIIDRETVLLTEIYLKSEHDSIRLEILIQRLKDQGLI